MIIAGFWIYPLYLGFYNIEYLPPPLTPGMTMQAHMESPAEALPKFWNAQILKVSLTSGFVLCLLLQLLI